jgi:hypothetical protein
MLKTKHLLKLFYIPKKIYIHQKLKKQKLDKVWLSLLPDSSQSSPAGKIKSILPREIYIGIREVLYPEVLPSQPGKEITSEMEL